MLDASRMRWTDMLNQARGFAEHSPQDGVERALLVLREIDAAVAHDPGLAAGLRDLRERALGLRATLAEAYARTQAVALERGVAYRTRILREISGDGQH